MCTIFKFAAPSVYANMCAKASSKAAVTHTRHSFPTDDLKNTGIRIRPNSYFNTIKPKPKPQFSQLLFTYALTTKRTWPKCLGTILLKSSACRCWRFFPSFNFSLFSKKSLEFIQLKFYDFSVFFIFYYLAFSLITALYFSRMKLTDVSASIRFNDFHLPNKNWNIFA